MASTNTILLQTLCIALYLWHSQSFSLVRNDIRIRPSFTGAICSTITESENEVRRNILDGVNGLEVEEGEQLADVRGIRSIFDALSNSETFRKEFWQKRPFLYSDANYAPLPLVKGSFTMEDVKEAVTADFIEAGRGSFSDGKTGWNMAAVSTPKGKSFQEAKMHFEDVEEALREKNGTVVFNSAGGFIPKIAAVCLETVNAFQLPAAVNMYITNPGQLTSAPPHTDKQDVFVLQSQGRKRWRVFSPPPPKRMIRADPFARGKGSDILEMAELEAPMLDIILSPGQVLYVPAGYPHTTDTTFIGEAGDEDVTNGEPSVHLTVGVDTLIWGLTYANLRMMCLARAGLPDKLLPTKLETEDYFGLQEALPFGFLTAPIVDNEEVKGNAPAMRAALYGEVRSELFRRMRSAEPTRFPAEVADEEMGAMMDVDESISRMIQHHYDVTNLFGELYDDVANKTSEAQMDLSYFRSQPYYQKLEKIMEALVQWGHAGKKKVEEGRKAVKGQKGFSAKRR